MHIHILYDKLRYKNKLVFRKSKEKYKFWTKSKYTRIIKCYIHLFYFEFCRVI